MKKPILPDGLFCVCAELKTAGCGVPPYPAYKNWQSRTTQKPVLLPAHKIE
ncbi:hypothetical protein CIT292_11216 [Citrobacter youngae ATCC 29220]|uniref:Uncharacterized protein n=1 Tax=Citrobacter youngae ATCC 29220 TaxID=500640 RepID=D4BKY6_9ENTR|nr:hypothetical protein CIT292_11216 [Citrobacter youngae ATCC 29220]